VLLLVVKQIDCFFRKIIKKLYAKIHVSGTLGRIDRMYLPMFRKPIIFFVYMGKFLAFLTLNLKEVQGFETSRAGTECLSYRFKNSNNLTLKKTALGISETSITLYRLTRRHIAEDFILYDQCCGKVQPHKREASFAKDPHALVFYDVTQDGFTYSNHKLLSKKQHTLRSYFVLTIMTLTQ
jgi:hypothetical protein